MAKKLLRCYAHGRGRHWEALCVDFDIAVQGTSLSDVRRQLHDAVVTYVEDAMNEEPRVARKLLNRKAPLLVRLKLELMSFWYGQRRRASGHDRYAGFDVSCHA